MPHITTEAEKAELTLIDDVFGILMDYQPGYDEPLGECPLAETRGGDRTTNKGRRQ